MDDELFAQSDAPSLTSESLAPWRILIVDDHEGVHDATKFALRDVTFLGRGLEFHHAYSGAEALAKIKAGASLVQLYSAFAYAGPALVGRIKAELAALLRAEGFRSVADAVGVEA